MACGVEFAGCFFFFEFVDFGGAVGDFFIAIVFVIDDLVFETDTVFEAVFDAAVAVFLDVEFEFQLEVEVGFFGFDAAATAFAVFVEGEDAVFELPALANCFGFGASSGGGRLPEGVDIVSGEEVGPFGFGFNFFCFVLVCAGREESET